MISIKNMFSSIDIETRNMKPGDQLIMSTYKKDRHIILINQSVDKWTVMTDGYTSDEVTNLSYKDALKLVKKYKDIEFPRSNKIYLSLRKKK